MNILFSKIKRFITKPKSIVCECMSVKNYKDWKDKVKNYKMFIVSESLSNHIDLYMCFCSKCNRRMMFSATLSLNCYMNTFDDYNHDSLPYISAEDFYIGLKEKFINNIIKVDSIYVTNLEDNQGNIIFNGYAIVKGKMYSGQIWAECGLPSYKKYPDIYKNLKISIEHKDYDKQFKEWKKITTDPKDGLPYIKPYDVIIQRRGDLYYLRKVGSAVKSLSLNKDIKWSANILYKFHNKEDKDGYVITNISELTTEKIEAH